jgi:PAS domain S-box-containing protein
MQREDVLAVLAGAGMYAWQWDITTGRLTRAAGIDELFGQPRGSVQTYDAFLAALSPEGREVVTTAVERALRGDTQGYYVEHRVDRTDASPRWLASQGYVLRDAERRAVRMTGVIWEITARKEREARAARLDRSSSVVREINRTILRATSETELVTNACRIAVEQGLFRFAWVGVIPPDGSASIELAAQWGHDAGYLGKLREELVPDDPVLVAIRRGEPWIGNDIASDAQFAPRRAAAEARGYRSLGAFPLRRSGRLFGALSVYADRPHVFDDELVGLLLGLVDDLSNALTMFDREAQRRATEEALKSSEERYRAVFEQAFEGIFLVAPTRGILDANDSACKMLAYTHEALVTLRADDVIHPEDLQAAPIRFGSIPRGGVILSERRFVRSDGSVMHGELTTKALLDGNFQVVVRDVSERKQVQAQLLLSDRLSSLGRLASGVAHEINNPMAYVTLNLELLASRLAQLSPPVDPKVAARMQEAVQSAREGAERVRQIVKTLTAFGRGDEERVGSVDVNAVMDSAIDVAAMQLHHTGRVVRDYAKGTVATANAFRLGQVFVNLLLNAVDALPEGETANLVRVRTYTDGDGRVVTEVRDNGIGIPANAKSRIFDPFFTTKGVGKGMGLGLSVCHTIVTSLGGEISCTSTPCEGTTFRVVLPPASAVESAGALVTAPTPATVHGRVLILDDDLFVGKALAAALEGHEVVVVSSGADALERCRTERFDCVLCDVNMPGLSGLDVYDALRREGRGLERGVLFMTGGTLTDATREALTQTSTPILEKPVGAAALRRAIAAAIERTRRAL